MKGLTLARAYYDTYIDQLLEKVSQAKGHIAAGLVGEGSQCFGFDDGLSQDHDFAPGFCIWLNDKDYADFGQLLQQAYDALPSAFQGFSRDNIIAHNRLGVMKISDYYRQFTGSPSGIPENMMNWLFTPEVQLAAATNGEIFRDDTGEFTKIREELLQFYPEDIRRKKIAARAAVMSQAGQYNLLRCIKRGETIAALQALSRFTEAAISMVFLLNRRYTPFYKWSFHAMRLEENNELAVQLCPLIEKLLQTAGLMSSNQLDEAWNLAFQLTEDISVKIAAELNRQGISQCRSAFLQDHLGEIMAGIQDPQIRRLPPMIDCQN